VAFSSYITHKIPDINQNQYQPKTTQHMSRRATVALVGMATLLLLLATQPPAAVPLPPPLDCAAVAAILAALESVKPCIAPLTAAAAAVPLDGRLRGRSCALVGGHGGSLPLAAQAAIDGHQLVVRMNNHSSAGRGAKTGLRITNRHRDTHFFALLDEPVLTDVQTSERPDNDFAISAAELAERVRIAEASGTGGARALYGWDVCLKAMNGAGRGAHILRRHQHFTTGVHALALLSRYCSRVELYGFTCVGDAVGGVHGSEHDFRKEAILRRHFSRCLQHVGLHC